MGAEMAGKIAVGAQAAGAIGSTYAAYRKSAGEKQGYEVQAQVAKNNAQLAEWQADDALNRGATSEQTSRLNTAQLYGKQTSIIASRNVAINEGSALNILADTKFMGERDALVIRDNASKEAWGYKQTASNYRSNADFLSARADDQSPLMDAVGTLLTTGGRVASSWYNIRTKTTGTGSSASPFGT